MQLTVNGTEQRVPDAWRDEALLSTLREYFGLVGARYSCGTGLCGACKVLVDGVPVSSCSVRTADVEGRTILTIEGLARPDGRLHPLQQAWIAERVPQCGYCQSGQIIQALALLSGKPAPERRRDRRRHGREPVPVWHLRSDQEGDPASRRSAGGNGRTARWLSSPCRAGASCRRPAGLRLA